MTNNISVTIKCAPEYIRVCNSVAVSAASVAGLDIEATTATVGVTNIRWILKLVKNNFQLP